MTRDAAFQAMLDGAKITHRNFTDDEYFEIIHSGQVMAEDGVNHTDNFWSAAWMSDGWSEYIE